MFYDACLDLEEIYQKEQDDLNNALVFDFEAFLSDDIGKTGATIVCKYWMEGRCARDVECEFMHEYDEDSVPLCQFGRACNRLKKCKFKHIDPEKGEKCIK